MPEQPWGRWHEKPISVRKITVVAVLVAFAVFSFVVGFIFELVKIALVVAVIAAVIYFVTRHARR
mgnify:CR=1 FL=1